MPEKTSDLIHIRVGKKLRQEMEGLVEEGLFSNQSELAREALRDLLVKYKKIRRADDEDL